MTPALFRSAVLTMLNALSLGACTTAPATKYHLVPEPSPGAMIAVAPASSATLRTGLSIDRRWVAFDDATPDRRVGEALAPGMDRPAGSHRCAPPARHEIDLGVLLRQVNA